MFSAEIEHKELALVDVLTEVQKLNPAATAESVARFLEEKGMSEDDVMPNHVKAIADSVNSALLTASGGQVLAKRADKGLSRSGSTAIEKPVLRQRSSLHNQEIERLTVRGAQAQQSIQDGLNNLTVSLAEQIKTTALQRRELINSGAQALAQLSDPNLIWAELWDAAEELLGEQQWSDALAGDGFTSFQVPDARMLDLGEMEGLFD